ncbi:MAG: hemolysin III family protein [Gemmatimonadetes bacterium]|nr:hemolysin III family protein [Gemmatimonadota bacterium]NNM04739.1 hemolysin III family protein [Gemmatimonadota bacterium]
MATGVQSKGEELANSVSHGIGFAASLAAIPILVVSAARNGDAGSIVGGAIFGSAVAILYLASTLYHAVGPGRAKQLLRRFDHSAIFLLIAGTYTPFTLGVLGGAWGWSLFGVVWGIAVIGIGMKMVAGPKHPRISSAMYVAMGWLVVLAIRPLWLNLPGWGLVLLVSGGLAYTGGVAFYLAPRLRYAHFIWHLFVLAGTTLHFFAVLRYAA